MSECETQPFIQVDAKAFLDELGQCLAETELDDLRRRVATLTQALALAPVVQGVPLYDPGVMAAQTNGSLVMRRDILLEELDQVKTARTLRRAHYYLSRLKKGATEIRTTALNDINLNRWKEYDEVLTDSLWLMDRRDTSGAHEAWYWGNYIPQIPRQLMLRYTKVGDWVLDPFVGSGTSLIECRRLGRNGMGVELNPTVAAQAIAVVDGEPNPYDVTTQIVVGDSTGEDFGALLAAQGCDQVQLVLLHPPYHDIIRFGEQPGDLSNAPSVDAFVTQFSQVVQRAMAVLQPGRFLAVVIGDKYEERAWVPLGFYVMQAVLDQGATLKSIVVKNLNGTRAKRDQQALWRYRALVAGFYLFKHEYIFIFQA
ncbi:MAG: DNA methyltransferase [Anaerolineae bacterium]|nr:DNA methyltransferase [Anaerolineae bacterium]